MSHLPDRAEGDRGVRESRSLPPAMRAADAPSVARGRGRRSGRHSAARLEDSPLDWKLSVPDHAGWLGAIGERRLDGDAIERLARLRRILPLLAGELARVRRDAAALRVENRRLLDRLHALERDLAADAESIENARRSRPGAHAWPRG